MSMGQIGFKGSNQLAPFQVDVSQPSGGAQQILRFALTTPINLLPGQVFVLPTGQWMINAGRYTDVQWYDTNGLRWRNYPTQPGQQTIVSSDGQNFRVANTTGCPIGAVISNVGNGNAANGYNTVTVTPSAGNSTWGTLVGGSVNTTVTVATGGNFALPPVLMWQPASNQTYPFIPPTFYCNINSNGTINTVTCLYGGAGLTAVGTLTAVNQLGDNASGNASLTMNATLTNSGNLTAIWPLTPGQNGSTGLQSVPTFTFNVGGTMCANAIMNFTVSNFTVTVAGGNLGAAAALTYISANGTVTATQNAALTGADYGINYAMPRMAWLSGLSLANGNLSSNTSTVIVDAGKNLQAIPILTTLVANMNGTSTNSLPVLVAQVGGQIDTSYLQAV